MASACLLVLPLLYSSTIMDNEELVDKVIELYKSGDSPLAQQLIIGTTGKKQFRKAEIEFWSKIATLPQLAIFLEIRHTFEGLASVLYLLESEQKKVEEIIGEIF